MTEILAVQRKRKIMPKLAQKLTNELHINLDETRFCSNGSWIDGNSAVPK